MHTTIWLTAQTSAPSQRAGHYLPASSAHPAKMLPAIAAHAINAYTRPGDLVIDPMCGIGTTLVEAVRRGRRAFGTEYEPRWTYLARANVNLAHRHGHTARAEIACADARTLLHHLPAEHHGTAALVVTSPPYGSSVHGRVLSTRDSGRPKVQKFHDRYGTDPGNLAHVGTDRLLDAFTDILIQCRHALRPGGYAVITTRPWRERGELIDLPTAVLGAARAAGLVPVERCVALLAGIRDGHLVPRSSFFQMRNVRDARAHGTPFSVIAHEDSLVVRRPEPPRPGHAGAAQRDIPWPRAHRHKPLTAATFRSRTCTRERCHGR